MEVALHATAAATATKVLYLDELVLVAILRELSVRDLRTSAAVCISFRAVAVEVASDALLVVLNKMSVLPLPQVKCLRAVSRISELGKWRSVEACTVLWLRAARAAVTIMEVPCHGRQRKRVSRWEDISGSGHHVSATEITRMPEYDPAALGGHGAIEFTGEQMLCSLPFVPALPQPLSMMIVARASGDVTICDSLTPRSARFELCHGYPSGDSRGAPEVVMTASGCGRNPPSPSHLLRGRTRSENKWHVYTAIYDGSNSELYVDGTLEASGKAVGSATLDGLRIGCDHSSTFFLKGAVAEVRLFSCHLSPQPRAQLEAAMALRHGLDPTSAPATSAATRLRRAASA